MAFPSDNGDISSTKVLYSQSLGGGQSSTGVSKNTKRLVVGEITAKWADAGIGVNFAGGPNAFGLNSVDTLKLQVIRIDTTYPDAEALPLANYDVTNQKIFVVADVGASTPDNPTAGQTIVLRYLACGDDVTAPEL